VTIEIKQQPGFCYEFFKNQAFWSHGRGIGYNPCSYYNGFIATDVDPQAAWYGAEHKKIIKDIKAGKLIEGCSQCYLAEKAGLKSRRMGSKDLYENYFKDTDIETTKSPTALDYSVGNLCNLKCTICNPSNSSKWIDDWAQLFPDKNLDHYRFRKNQYIIIDDLEYLKEVRSVHFHGGGDPLLSDAHVQLLRNIEKSKGLADVRVFYNINATNRVDDSVLELWSKLEMVQLYFSIDDVGERFEYQRTGARWSNVLDTIEWYKQNMPSNHMFAINCVWGYLNLYYLDELYNWHKENFSKNRLGDPTNLIFQKCLGRYSLDWVSKKTMQLLKDKFRDIPEITSLLAMLNTQETPHTEFWDIVNRTDSIRNSDFRKLCPEWSKLL